MAHTGRHMARGTTVRATRPIDVVFIVICLVVLLVPSVGLLVPGASGASSSSEQLAEMPQLLVDGTPNPSVLQDAGAYFEDHFAFRPNLIDADAHLRATLFGVSNTSSVVVGTEGWLYYGGELGDYRRTGQMSDAALRNAVRNVSLMQEYVTSTGRSFLFTIAPNKSTLYPTHMPYYEVRGEDASNLERITPLLAEEGVNYLDLREVLEAASLGGETLYLERDSHWTNAGALVGCEAMLDRLGRDHGGLDGTVDVRDDYTGDLARMLYPVTPGTEEQSYVETSFAYLTGETVEDSVITTQSGRDDATGSLLMYRDSFGNALVPLLAQSYRDATFSKRIPYNLAEMDTHGVDTVVVERAERHLSFFATNPPYMPAPERDVVADAAQQTQTTASVTENGPYLQIEGMVAEEYGQADHVYARVSSTADAGDGSAQTGGVSYEAFMVSQSDDAATSTDAERDGATLADDCGYRLFLDHEALVARLGEGPLSVEVIAEKDGVRTGVFAGTLDVSAVEIAKS